MCRRDFAQGFNGLEWCPVYVGVFKVEPLAEPARTRWLNEKCPSKPLAADDDDRALARAQQELIPPDSALSRLIPPKKAN